jgi:hypothetical protein
MFNTGIPVMKLVKKSFYSVSLHLLDNEKYFSLWELSDLYVFIFFK